VERFAAALFFVDEAMITLAEEAVSKGLSLFEEELEPIPDHGAPADGTADEESRVDLKIWSPSAEVVVSLVGHRRDKQCFCAAGGFAFYEPVELRVGGGRRDPVEEGLLQAFRRLFLQVVRDDAPRSLTELTAQLLARGHTLRLTRRSQGSGHGLPVRISRLEA
jgi:hypothetical protein